MDNYQLDYSDIIEIFKEKLKIENKVKTIDTIFNNKRNFNNIDYKPYFQRNYVWDDEKATYFIESILLGTEIPPLVFFQTNTKNEVIDGRQRFETIHRFLNDKLTLKNKGLKSLKNLSGKKYSQMDSKFRDIFGDTRIRILQFEVVNEPKLSEIKEDKIKKEIFRRYNSGITPLQKFDIETAMFINDDLTILLKKEINSNKELYEFLKRTILPKSKIKANDRDKINVLLSEIRELIALQYVPIYEYARNSKTDLIRKSYFTNVLSSNVTTELNKFLNRISILKLFYDKLIDYDQLEIKSMKLFISCIYWAISIISDHNINITEADTIKIYEIILNNNAKSWEKIIGNPTRDYRFLFEQTGSHYYAAVMNRFTFISNVFAICFNVSLYSYVKSKEYSNENEILEHGYSNHRINKANPETLSIEDIMRYMDRNRFLIRPNYQRSEVKNISKSSYLMESILLGINIPPLFVYKRKDGVKEVVDGQQRLLTILGFLGKYYIDENGKQQYSIKNKFKLNELKILNELKGKNIDQLNQKFHDKILDFQMDVIEIDSSQNPNFSPIDLFLRLNTKPYPIKNNTFEMWNACLDKRITIKAKELAKEYEGTVFRQKDKRMKVEELVTSLAYLDYKLEKGDNINSILCIYAKDEKLCARLMNKTIMTRNLMEISVNDTENFLSSLGKVKIFAEKVYILTAGENTNMKMLVNHSRKGTAFKTDQNFYFLWCMLKNIDIDIIKSNSDDIFKKIRDQFKELQKIRGNVDKERIENLLLFKQ